MNEFRIHDLPPNFDPRRDRLPFIVLYDGGCLGRFSLTFLLLSLPVIFALAISGAQLWRFNYSDILVGLSAFALTFFTVSEASRYIRARIKWLPLMQRGILLSGYIDKVVSDDKKPRGKWRDLRPYYITLRVLYSFENPSGDRITGKFTGVFYRFSLPRNLPQPGTPVKVLYADDHHHTLL